MSARGKLNPLAGSFVPAQPFGNSPAATQPNNNNGPTQRTPQPQPSNPFSSSGTPPPPATTTLTNQNQQKQVEDTRASLHKLLHHARLGVLQLLPQADHLPFERVLHRSFHVAHTQGKLSITSESVTGGGGASSRGGSAAAVSSPSSGGTESLFPVVQFPPPFWRYFNLTQLRSIAQLIAEIELGAAWGPPSSSSSPSSPSSAASSPSSPSCLHKADVELLKGIYIRSVSPLLPLETRKRLAAMGVEGPTTAAATTPDRGAAESASPAEGGSATAVPTATPAPVSGAFTDADLENVVSFIIDIYYLFFRMSFLPAVEEGGVAAYSAYVQHITQVRSYLLDVSQLYGKPFLRMVLPLMVVSRYYVSRLRQSGEASSPTAQVRLAFSANFIRLMTMFFSLCPGESAERAKDKIPAEYVQETQLILLTTTTEALAVFPALTSEEQKRGGSSMSGSDLFGTPTGSNSNNNHHNNNNNHHASVDWPYRRYTVAPWGYHIPSQASGGVRVEGSAVLSPASAASPLFPEIRSLPSWIESVLPTRRLPPRLHGTSFELRAVPLDGGDRECTSVMDDAVHGWDDFQQQQQQQQQQHQTPPNRTRSVDYGRATPPKPYVGAGTTTTNLSTESHQRLHHQQHPLGEGDAGGGPLHRHDGELDIEENDDDNLFRSESAFVGQCNDALSWFDEDQTVLFATLTLAHTDLVPTTTLVQILDALLGAYQNREGASFEPLLRLMMMLKGNDGADLLLGGGVPTLSDRLEEEEQTHSDETQAPADRLNSGESADGPQYRAHTSPPPVHLESTGNPFSIGGRRGSAATEEEEAEEDLLTDSEGYDSSSEGPLPQAFQEILDLLMQTIKAGKPQHLLALQAAHSIVQRRFEDEAKARRNNNMAPASLHTSPAVGPAMHGLIGGGTSVGSTQSIGQHWNALRQPETPKRTPHGGGSSRLLDDGGNGDEDDDDGEFGGGGGGGARPATEQLYRDDNSFRGTPGPGGIGGQTSFGMWPGVDDADASLVEVTQIGGTSVSSTNGLFQGNGSIW